jgi:hypothetical protein
VSRIRVVISDFICWNLLLALWPWKDVPDRLLLDTRSLE